MEWLRGVCQGSDPGVGVYDEKKRSREYGVRYGWGI